jgi:hypothetical protein
MTYERISKTKKVVIPIFIILLAVAVVEAMITSNEFGIADIILGKLLIPIIILSTSMSTYWILLTDDFWDMYERIDLRFWTAIKTGLKFLVWIPGMGLYFFAVTQGLLSIYNRSVGEQKIATISGRIIDKDKYRNRCYFEIKDLSLDRNVEIKVDAEDYERFSAGDNYKAERKIGALGFIYEAR